MMESYKVVVIYYILAFYQVKFGILLNFDFGYFWKWQGSEPNTIGHSWRQDIRV